jgi:serine protease
MKMFSFNFYKSQLNKVFFCYQILFFLVILLFLIPEYGAGQFFGVWPGAYSGFSGFFSPGASGSPITGLFSPTSSSGGNQSLYNPFTFMTPFSNFAPLGNGTNGFSSFTPQTSGGTGGFNQTGGAPVSFGWGYPLSTGLFQPSTSFGYPSPYTSNIQSNGFFRNTASSQNFLSFNSTPWGGSSNIFGSYQSPLNWTQSYSGLNNYPSQTTTNNSQIAEMPPVSQNHGDKEDYVSNQVLVKFHANVSKEKQKMIHDSHGCRELYESEYAGFIVVEIPAGSTVEDIVDEYLQEDDVLYAEPNYIRHSHLTPNDPYFYYQWHHPMMKNTSAWDLNKGSGVKVALLDSGVAYRTASGFTKAPDLGGTSFSIGWDFVNADPYPDDDYGHGTHMAGCIAQTTNNFLGVAGVAYLATIMPVKIMDEAGSVTLADEIDGIYYAVNNGADIINLSLGGQGTSVTEQAAVTYAVNSGVVMICSAGNSGSSTPEYPASYPQCISVSAVKYDKTLAPYSNYGTEIDVCAPGGDITIDQNYDSYGDGILQQTHNGTNLSAFYYYFMEGTSPAAALVSGVAALIIGKSTANLTPQQIKTILTSSATDLGTSGWDQFYGSGLVNSYNALLITS